MDTNRHHQAAHGGARSAGVKRTVLPIAALISAAATLLACWSSTVPAAYAGTAVAATSGPAPSAAGPVVQTADGAVRGVATSSGVEFRGIPYAAPPTGDLRWKSPQPVPPWSETRDATVFPPVCPQAPPSPWGQSEDCLKLNVTTPTQGTAPVRDLPVIVWFHGGGFSYGEGADYDPAKLASDGAVVVTLNYRLGLLGFLAHPALADRRGSATGNFGYQDQQAALRWVQHNIEKFGGDPGNVTIAGHSAGGLSVLAQLASPGAKGLFHRAVIQAGAFAPQQNSLTKAEKAGKATAVKLGCADQSAQCLRHVSVDALVANAQDSFTPGYVDGVVLRESVGEAIASGRFNRVPIINGTNTQEERIFTEIGLSVTDGTTVHLPTALDAANYVSTIATNFGVNRVKATRIAAEYPLSAYASAAHAFSALNSDANFSCPALALDKAASRHVPTFAYEFNDGLAPARDVLDTFGPPFAATHQSELQYLFGLPNARYPGELSADQERLAATMRAAWTQFASTGDPSTAQTPWQRFTPHNAGVLSLETPSPKVEHDFAIAHKCGFWARTSVVGTS